MKSLYELKRRVLLEALQRPDWDLNSGLCILLTILVNKLTRRDADVRISPATCTFLQLELIDLLYRFYPDNYSGFWWPLTPAGADCRRTALAMMLAMIEEQEEHK